MTEEENRKQQLILKADALVLCSVFYVSKMTDFDNLCSVFFMLVK